MEVIAVSKYVRQSPRKLRLAAQDLRGLKAAEALIVLDHLNKKGAEALLLTLKQGVANAVNNFNLEKENLKIKSLQINKGPQYKRRDKSRREFRWGMIQKKTAHIRLVLEGEETAKKPAEKTRKKAESVKKEKEKNGSKN